LLSLVRQAPLLHMFENIVVTSDLHIQHHLVTSVPQQMAQMFNMTPM
jgi:hypothetical protein